MVEFRKTAILSEFSMDATVSLPAGKYVELVSMTVPSQQIRFWGNGNIINGVDDRGTLKLNVKTSVPANIPGTARLVVSDANKIIRNFRREDRSEDLVTGIRIGKDMVGSSEDSFLILEYAADAAATATKADSSISAPITVRTA